MDEIVAQAFVFFVAGFETTSTTTGFAMWELARHQDIQTKLRKEIDEALKKANGKVTYELLTQHIPYTDKVRKVLNTGYSEQDFCIDIILIMLIIFCLHRL